jgi:hypothetical protein
MKLVLVNSPQLIIPGGPTGNSMITIVPTGSAIPVSCAVVPVIDPTMSVDNYSVVTQLQVSVAWNQGQASGTDIITINGTSVSTTINNRSMVLQFDFGKGALFSATVSLCGQTSTFVD